MLSFFKNIIDPPEKNLKIFYLHIPKCAGTSVNRSIIGLYKPWRPGQADKVFHLEDPAARVAEDTLLMPQAEIRNPLLAYALSLKRVRLVIGHFVYSEKIHEATHSKINGILLLCFDILYIVGYLTIITIFTGRKNMKYEMKSMTLLKLKEHESWAH